MKPTLKPKGVEQVYAFLTKYFGTAVKPTLKPKGVEQLTRLIKSATEPSETYVEAERR